MALETHSQTPSMEIQATIFSMAALAQTLSLAVPAMMLSLSMTPLTPFPIFREPMRFKVR